MVSTGSSAYIIRRYELHFGVTDDDSTTMLFGFDQKMSGLEWMNGQQPVPNLYTPEVETFLYGKNSGGASVEYTLGNSYWLTGILNNPVVDTTTGGISTRMWTSNPQAAGATYLNNSRVLKTQSLEIGMALIEDGNKPRPIRRFARGAVTQSVNMKSSIDNPVAITENLVWGIEDDLGERSEPIPDDNEDAPDNDGDDTDFTSPLASTIPDNSGHVPLNFVNSLVQLKYDSSLEDLVKIQDVDFTFTRNSELLYGFNKPDSVDGYFKLAELTGKITLAFDNADVYKTVDARKKLDTMTMLITNGLTGSAERSLTFTFSGVGLSRHSVPDIQPGEPIFQEFDFQCERIEVTAIDATPKFDWS